MHHSEIFREIMVLNDITTLEMAEHFGITHVAILNRIKSKAGGLRTLLQMVEYMGYEIVIRPRTSGDLPEGEYALRPTDYSAK